MKKNKIKKHHRINNEITFNQVKLVGDNVEVGDYSLQEALNIAQEKELDLVLINEQNRICKITDYSKMLYELNKKNKPNKAPEVKELKFSASISEGDITYRIKHLREFLEDGHKVKLSLKFKGREIVIQKDMGKEVLLKVAVAVEDIGIAESLPTLEGKQLFMMIKPKPKNK